MSAVLCLPACLCMFAAASRGQAPHGNASGPALSLWLACSARGCVPRGWWEADPGWWPHTAVRAFWCEALSLSRPLVPWGGQPGFCDPCFAGAVGVGVGTRHRPHSVRSCEPSLRVVGVAGGRPRGGLPCAVVRGVRFQALSLPRPPVFWAGRRGPLPTCCARGCAGVGA